MSAKSGTVTESPTNRVTKDDMLSTFISQTQVEPSFAVDMLEATGWNLTQALATFEGMKDIYVCTVAELDEQPTAQPAPESVVNAREGVGRRKGSKTERHGLAAVGEEATREFYKEATSVSVVKSEKHVTFEERFFADTFHCLDFSQFEDEFQEFLAGDLIENSHKCALEKAGLLNWRTSEGKLSQLVPLATSGDGNCLLHAASLYMWGLQDQQLILRNSLYKLLTSGLKKDAIMKRWRQQTEIRNKEAGGLTFSEEEWHAEWTEIVRVACSKPRRTPSTETLKRYSTLRLNYECLEEIHVFALAHVLRRPIIVVADNVLRGISGDELAPVYFGGIYLPLEEQNASVCCKVPVILTYHASHFAALVAKENGIGVKSGKKGVEHVIPLVTPDGKLLPLRFENEARPVTNSSDKFDEHSIQLLDKYLHIQWIKLSATNKCATEDVDADYDHLPPIRFPAALIEKDQKIPPYQQTLIQKYIENAHVRFEKEKLMQQQLKEEKARKEKEKWKKEEEQQMNRPVPCQGKDCTMFGTPATKFLCSRCAKQSLDPSAPVRPQPTSDVATPSPAVVNPCQISGCSRQSSENEILAQPSQHSSTSKEIPPFMALQNSNPSSKVHAASLGSPKLGIMWQDPNKQVVADTPKMSSTTKTADQLKNFSADQTKLQSTKKGPENSLTSPTTDKVSAISHSGIRIEVGVANDSSSLSTKLKPVRILQVHSKGKYSRDAIQPLTAKDKGTCATEGCSFYARSQSKYCTQCSATQPPHS